MTTEAVKLVARQAVGEGVYRTVPAPAQELALLLRLLHWETEQQLEEVLVFVWRRFTFLAVQLAFVTESLISLRIESRFTRC